MNREEIDEIAEGAIVLDGFDDCIIGVSESFGQKHVSHTLNNESFKN